MFRARNTLRKQSSQLYKFWHRNLGTPGFTRSFSNSGKAFTWLYTLPVVVVVVASSFSPLFSKQETPLLCSESNGRYALEPLLVLYYTNKPCQPGAISDIPAFVASRLVSERLHRYSHTKDKLSVKDELLLAMATRLALLRRGGTDEVSAEMKNNLQMFAETESIGLKDSPFGREKSDLSLMTEDAKTVWITDGIAYFIMSEDMDKAIQLPLEKCMETLIARDHFENSKFMTELGPEERMIVFELYKEAQKACQKGKVGEEIERLGLPVAPGQDVKLMDAMMDVYWRLSKEEVLKGVVHN
ncbi:hypothetical protein FKW77_008745 [Venturia effusa]|uniref:Uncharacterized protein n=1 Tax=Venturia effusa TaxID=50376 RepID=A0A517L7W9_9PEZI|nr:hypothetical protein FKW77_008745 [Venturia effusa]